MVYLSFILSLLNQNKNDFCGQQKYETIVVLGWLVIGGSLNSTNQVFQQSQAVLLVLLFCNQNQTKPNFRISRVAVVVEVRAMPDVYKIGDLVW